MGSAAAAADVGTITEYTIPTINSTPRGIVAGPDGRLWFTEYAGNKVGRITTTGQIGVGDEITMPTANVSPSGITAGPDGNLWFTEFAGGANSRVGRIPPSATSSSDVLEIPVPTANSSPEGITAGPDGRIWFTEYGSLKSGRVGGPPAPAAENTPHTPVGISRGGLPGPLRLLRGPGGGPWVTAVRQKKD